MGHGISGKQDGATVLQWGGRHDISSSLPWHLIVKEEIFGPFGVEIKFDDEAGPGLWIYGILSDKLTNTRIGPPTFRFRV